MRNNYLFTSESVTEGHPDKIADQISDGILDAIIAQDKYSRVACETILTTGIAFVAGEISTKAYVEIPDRAIARKSSLWVEYETVEAETANFAMRRVFERKDIFPVFRELFKKEVS